MSTSTVITPAIIQELLEKHREVLLSSLVKMLPAAPAPTSSSDASIVKAGRKKKEKKAVDPDAPPKEKRPPNAWILFAMRVEGLVRAAEDAAGKTSKDDRMHTVVIKQFASHLKSVKPYDDWADNEITEAMTTWTPPEVSKQAAAKAAEAIAAATSDAGSVASSDDTPADAGAPTPTPADAEKAKRKWSDEAKAAAAAKRAAKKAASSDAPVPAADAPTPADAGTPAPAPAAKKVAVKPKKAAAPPPPPTEKKVDLSFYSWTHDGKEYYTNDRGDVVTTDFEWVGRFDGKAIDEHAAEPADLAEATLRDA